MTRSLIVVVCAVTTVGLTASCAEQTATVEPAVAPAVESPLAGVDLYVEPDKPAARQADEWAAAGRRSDAAALRRLAEEPTGIWFSGQHPDVFTEAERVTTAAAEAGQVPLLVLYNVPNRDCDLFSAGGAASIDDYLDWVGSLAAGIGDRPAVVVLEPDAVAQAFDGCLTTVSAEERFATLREAVRILERQPATTVYLDAGNSAWVQDVDGLADALRRSGVAEADGFALNVSNFQTTEDSTRYGRELSRLLDGAHFVIDTSRNGAGAPPPDATAGSRPVWCNPPGAQIGHAPTADTGDELVDAWLWIKPPGDSDGDCSPEAPPAGTWWPEYALELLP